MADAIDRSQHFVHVEFFILVQDEATAPPSSMPWSGRVSAEFRYGCFPIMSPSSCTRTARRRSAGLPPWAPSTAMLPLQPLRGHWRRPDLRNHRKLVVVDGVIGFTGSQN